MILLGITGIIGSGKSTVSDMIAKKGLPVLDLDRLAKESYEWDGVKESIARTFGDDYVQGGGVAVEKLREIVFTDPEKLRLLEELIHPRVEQALLERAAELGSQGARTVVVDAPLLFETDLHKKVQKIVVVTASMETIRHRLRRRGMEEMDVERRIPFQIPLEEKEKMADYVIHNDGTLGDLETEVDTLLAQVKSWEVEVDAS